MTSIDFTKENRLPISAIFFLIIVSMKNAAKELWPILLVVFFPKVTGLVFLENYSRIAGAYAVWNNSGVLMYRNFTYAVKDD